MSILHTKSDENQVPTQAERGSARKCIAPDLQERPDNEISELAYSTVRLPYDYGPLNHLEELLEGEFVGMTSF